MRKKQFKTRNEWRNIRDKYIQKNSKQSNEELADYFLKTYNKKVSLSVITYVKNRMRKHSLLSPAEIKFVENHYKTMKDKVIAQELSRIFNKKVWELQIRWVRTKKGLKRGKNVEAIVAKDAWKGEGFEAELQRLEKLGETLLGDGESC